VRAAPGFDRKGLATALNAVEAQVERDPVVRFMALEEAWMNARAGCRVVGLTGPPGVGKSTLSGRLIERWRARDLTVGVLCIDPSSRRSGGALLGDRVRMRLSGHDQGVFVRSMAARERLGGLAPATFDAVCVMRRFVDRVLVETVGVGQSEVDVSRVADLTAVVIQPGSGDALQFLKAGLMEVFDLLVVNKADLGSLAEAARRELVAALRVQGRREAALEVCSVSAERGDGLEALVSAIESYPVDVKRREESLREQVIDAEVRWRGLERVMAAGGVMSLRRMLEAKRRPGEMAGALFRD
jgi:LAO/AO transport system kinase